MDCLDSIFQVWSDKGFVQGEKNTGGKGSSVKEAFSGKVTDSQLFD